MSKKSDIVAGNTYIFTKSGRKVVAIEPTDYIGKGGWIVQRKDTGKKMVVRDSSLVPEDHPDFQL